MSPIIRWCLTNRPVVILFSLILLGAGIVSLFQINQELLPSIELPGVSVMISDQGASPAQVDHDVTQPLVKGLSKLAQKQHINSISSQGFSQINIQFNLDSSLQEDEDAVNRALPQVTLPSNASKPQVQTLSFSSVPSIIYSLEAKDSNLERITEEANQVIVPALNGATGAAQIQVSGGAEQEITINLDQSKLASNNVSVPQVQQALDAAQVDIPAGESLKGGKALPVQVLGTVKSIDDLKALIVSGPGSSQGTPPSSSEAMQPDAYIKPASAFSNRSEPQREPPHESPSHRENPYPQDPSSPVFVPVPAPNPYPNVPAPNPYPSLQPIPAPSPSIQPAPNSPRAPQPTSPPSPRTSRPPPAKAISPAGPSGIIDQPIAIAVPPSGTSIPPPSLPTSSTPVHLGQVANISQDPVFLNGISRTNGVPSLQIEVIKSPDSNAVTLSNDIQHRISGLHLTAADSLVLLSDSAQNIHASLNDLILEGLLGALLAILVIFFFLRSFRATMVTAISLPTSVLVAILGTRLWGFSLNVLTLAGLTVAVGRIVDDAIVVLENSYRHLKEGESPLEATLRGTTEVSMAVISSTLTTVAVFLPLGLAGGIISRFFLPFSVTVAISLLASLLVALTLIPVLISLFLNRGAKRWLTRLKSSKKPEEGAPGRIIRLYRRVLGYFLKRGWRKAWLLLFTLLLLLSSLSTLLFIPKNFFDLSGTQQLTGEVNFPPGTTSDETSKQLQSFENAAQADPAVKLVQVMIDSSLTGHATGASANQANVVVMLKNKSNSPQVTARLREKLNQLYGADNVQLSGDQDTSSNGFVATLSGSDQSALSKASDQIVAKLSQNPNLANVNSDISASKPELLISVDPSRASAHGLSPQLVASIVSNAFSVKEVGNLNTNGSPVRIKVDPNALTPDQLPNLPLTSGVTLKDVANITTNLAPATITRVDNVQQVKISADILAKDTQGVTDQATTQLTQLTLPKGVSLDSGASNQELSNSFNQMLEAIAVAIGAVFLILVIFFRSLLTPLIILMTMPLALIGSLVALFFSGQALGLPALLGLSMVFGIVVSNAILLIDFTERNRKHTSIDESLMLAGSVRLRPILMTALATIMALVPVALGISTSGGGGLISQSLAIVVEGGLISSTLFSLLVIPVIYSILRRKDRADNTSILTR